MQKNRYQIPDHPDKVVFSQSWLSMWFDCPLRFSLAYNNTANWDSEATRKGNIFERLVLGDFDGKLSEYSYGPKAKGQIQIQKCADDFLEKYPYIRGEVQPKIVVDLGKYGAGGTLDQLGHMVDDNESINDLKYCDNPMRSTFYNPLASNQSIAPNGEIEVNYKDILQPITYTYLVYKKYGKILPFKRIVVSPLGNDTNVWIKTFNVGTASFRWLEQQLETIYTSWSMAFTSPTEDQGKCYNKRSGACKYLQFCKVGKERIFTNDVVNVDELLGVEELMY